MKSYIFEVVKYNKKGYEEIKEIRVKADSLEEATEIIEKKRNIIKYKFLKMKISIELG